MDITLIWDSLPKLLTGMILTVEITGLSLIFGIIIAIPLALMRLSKSKRYWMPAYAFIFYFRGTPILVQIFIVYYGSGQFQEVLSQIGLWYLFREAYFCGVLAFTMNTAAYTAEILRGSIQSVPVGEIEAGLSCGMSRWVLNKRIILPKAFRLGWPAYTNEIIFLLQATSLISIITLMDITGVARFIAAQTFAFYELYITAAALYLVLVYGLHFIFKMVERRLLTPY